MYLALALPSIGSILDRFGPLAVFLFVVVENFGAPIPGETMLVAASAYAARGHLSIVLVAIFCIVGVWCGSTLSYLAGRRGGVALMRRLHVPEKQLMRAQKYMVRWGGHTVLLGRYVAFLRSYLGWLAGINRMELFPFLLWNLAGAIMWTLTFATLGYLLGNNIDRIIKLLGYAGVAVVVIAFIGYFGYRRYRETRGAAMNESSSQLQAEAVHKEPLISPKE